MDQKLKTWSFFLQFFASPLQYAPHASKFARLLDDKRSKTFDFSHHYIPTWVIVCQLCVWFPLCYTLGPTSSWLPYLLNQPSSRKRTTKSNPARILVDVTGYVNCQTLIVLWSLSLFPLPPICFEVWTFIFIYCHTNIIIKATKEVCSESNLGNLGVNKNHHFSFQFFVKLVWYALGLVGSLISVRGDIRPQPLRVLALLP